MMKLSGAGIIWICLTITGFRISFLLKSRRTLLEKTVNLIVRLKIELDCRRDVMLNLLNRVSNCSFLCSLDYLRKCEVCLKKGVDFPTAWKRAVNESCCPYTKAEKEKLISLGEILGTTDTESQIMMLTLYEEYMKDFLNNAEKSQREYGTLSCAAGFLLGLAVFVLAL